MSNYWRICITETLDEIGLAATPEQVNQLVDSVEMAHSMYGEAHGHHHIENPLATENRDLKRKLDIERRKVVCKECGGSGRIIESCGTFVSNGSCWKCHGDGYLLP